MLAGNRLKNIVLSIEISHIYKCLVTHELNKNCIFLCANILLQVKVLLVSCMQIKVAQDSNSSVDEATCIM